MTKTFLAYIAGFLDADGSIYVRLKPNEQYRYGYQIAPNIVLYQKSTEQANLSRLQKQLNIGYLRHRKDGITEFTIGDRKSLRYLLTSTLPYLLFKKQQAKLMLKILDLSETIKTANNFLKVAKLIDQFGELNYSKKRSINSQMVNDHLIKQRLLTP